MSVDGQQPVVAIEHATNSSYGGSNKLLNQSHSDTLKRLKFVPKTAGELQRAKSRTRERQLRKLSLPKSQRPPMQAEGSSHNIGFSYPPTSDCSNDALRNFTGFDYLMASKRVARQARNRLIAKKHAHNLKERELVLRMVMTVTAAGMRLTGKESWLSEIFRSTLLIQRWWRRKRLCSNRRDDLSSIPNADMPCCAQGGHRITVASSYDSNDSSDSDSDDDDDDDEDFGCLSSDTVCSSDDGYDSGSAMDTIDDEEKGVVRPAAACSSTSMESSSAEFFHLQSLNINDTAADPSQCGSLRHLKALKKKSNFIIAGNRFRTAMLLASAAQPAAFPKQEDQPRIQEGCELRKNESSRHFKTLKKQAAVVIAGYRIRKSIIRACTMAGMLDQVLQEASSDDKRLRRVQTIRSMATDADIKTTKSEHMDPNTHFAEASEAQMQATDLNTSDPTNPCEAMLPIRDRASFTDVSEHMQAQLTRRTRAVTDLNPSVDDGTCGSAQDNLRSLTGERNRTMSLRLKKSTLLDDICELRAEASAPANMYRGPSQRMDDWDQPQSSLDGRNSRVLPQTRGSRFYENMKNRKHAADGLILASSTGKALPGAAGQSRSRRSSMDNMLLAPANVKADEGESAPMLSSGRSSWTSRTCASGTNAVSGQQQKTAMTEHGSEGMAVRAGGRFINSPGQAPLHNTLKSSGHHMVQDWADVQWARQRAGMKSMKSLAASYGEGDLAIIDGSGTRQGQSASSAVPNKNQVLATSRDCGGVKRPARRSATVPSEIGRQPQHAITMKLHQPYDKHAASQPMGQHRRAFPKGASVGASTGGDRIVSLAAARRRTATDDFLGDTGPDTTSDHQGRRRQQRSLPVKNITINTVFAPANRRAASSCLPTRRSANDVPIAGATACQQPDVVIVAPCAISKGVQQRLLTARTNASRTTALSMLSNKQQVAYHSSKSKHATSAVTETSQQQRMLPNITHPKKSSKFNGTIFPAAAMTAPSSSTTQKQEYSASYNQRVHHLQHVLSL